MRRLLLSGVVVGLLGLIALLTFGYTLREHTDIAPGTPGYWLLADPIVKSFADQFHVDSFDYVPIDGTSPGVERIVIPVKHGHPVRQDIVDGLLKEGFLVEGAELRRADVVAYIEGDGTDRWLVSFFFDP